MDSVSAASSSCLVEFVSYMTAKRFCDAKIKPDYKLFKQFQAV